MTADRGLPPELTAEELDHLNHEGLVRRCLEMQRAYVSLLNAITLYKRQLDAIRTQSMQSSQIADLSRKVNIADLQVLAEVAVRDMPRFLEAEASQLWLFDAESRLLTLYRSQPGLPPQPALHLETDRDTLPVDCLRNHTEPLIVENPAHYERLAGRELRTLPSEDCLDRGALLCPLRLRLADREEPLLLGVLLLGRKPGGFHAQDADLATLMSEMLATSISTTRLIEQMRHLAETDGLTGLYNHRHFQQELDRAVASARRYGNPLSLLMLDIDHFKAFNDTHGHQVGDLVLREVAHTLRGCVRDQIDLPARYGGEEFVVLLPSTDLAGARVAAERIRAGVEAAHVPLAGEQLRITVSVGIAAYEPPAGKGALIEAADAALYRAKRSGRNRIEAAPDAAPD